MGAAVAPTPVAAWSSVFAATMSRVPVVADVILPTVLESASARSVTLPEPVSVSTVPAPVNAMSLFASSDTSPPLLVIAAATTMSSDASSSTEPAESIASFTVIVLWAERVTDVAAIPTRLPTPPISTSPVLSIQRPPCETVAARWLTLVWSGAWSPPMPVTATSRALSAYRSPGPSRSTIDCVASIRTRPLVAVICPTKASPVTSSVTSPCVAVADSTSTLPSDRMNMPPVPVVARRATAGCWPEGAMTKNASAAPIVVPAARLTVLAETLGAGTAASPRPLVMAPEAASVAPSVVDDEVTVPTVIDPCATSIAIAPDAVTWGVARSPDTCRTSRLPRTSATNDPALPTCMRSGLVTPSTTLCPPTFPADIVLTLNSPAATTATSGSA